MKYMKSNKSRLKHDDTRDDSLFFVEKKRGSFEIIAIVKILCEMMID